MDNIIVKFLSFHYDTKEAGTNETPNLHGRFYDAVIQIEWDCADENVDQIMENDIRPVVLGESLQEKNLMWIHNIRSLACEKLDQFDESQPLFISLHKVMDGIVSCYITPDRQDVYLEEFDMVLEGSGYLRMTYDVPYHTMGRPYVSLRGKCMYNDSIEEGYVE